MRANRACPAPFHHLCSQVTGREIGIWNTPDGVLSSEFGLQAEFSAEAAVEKNVRKVCASSTMHLCQLCALLQIDLLLQSTGGMDSVPQKGLAGPERRA